MSCAPPYVILDFDLMLTIRHTNHMTMTTSAQI